MLGREVVEHLVSRGWDVTSPWKTEFDLNVADHLSRLRRGLWGSFEWLLNCAAYTAVDAAESDIMAAMRVNAVGAGALASICNENGWRMLQVSTDFVFDGTSRLPITEDSPANPLNTYGKSKLLGEQNVMNQAQDSLVVRTSWLFGRYGKCFPRAIIEKAKSGASLKVVNDQTGSPTSTKQLAHTLESAMSLGLTPGIYHATGPDPMTWFDFAVKTLIEFGMDVPVEPISTQAYPTPARRPAYSVLDNTKLTLAGVTPMEPLAQSLAHLRSDGFQ